MKTDLRYTDNEIAVIDGVLGFLYPRMVSEPLRRSFLRVHEHLKSGAVELPDLQRIASALEFTYPGQCVSCNKESYREVTHILLKTKAMLRAYA